MNGGQSIAAIGAGSGWHATELVDASERAGHALQLFNYEDLSAGENVCLAGQPIDRFDVVLARTMPAASLECLTLRLSMLHEAARRIRIVNPPQALEWAIDKYRTIQFARKLNLPTIETRIAQDRTTALMHYEELGGDVVVKPIFGGEGRGVMRIQQRELARTVFTTLQTAGLIIHQQPFVKPGGIDRRVLVIGPSHYTIERTGRDDFRTNRCAGGLATRVDDDPMMIQNSRQIANEMQLTIAAVDWIVDPTGRWRLIEINAIPGWKTAQTVIAESIADQIIAAAVSA